MSDELEYFLILHCKNIHFDDIFQIASESLVTNSECFLSFKTNLLKNLSPILFYNFSP